ncbi:MAG: hypothetical protein LUQ57_03515 [Methylococcaceae bacterium]|nr:hypothetical protein [Methylococcaceae bacterium]
MNDTKQQIEKEVRETVESGVDIYERVRSITLKALTERTLDIDNIRDVMESVLKGMSDGLSHHYDPAKHAFKQSAEALDDVLTKTAEASKLAIEEAASNVDELSSHDFKQAAEDLKSLEGLFLDTIETVGRHSNETASKIAKDFLAHAQANGTAVGRQSRIILEGLDNLRITGQHAVMTGAVATTSALAKIAAGFLAGLAESIHPEKSHK